MGTTNCFLHHFEMKSKNIVIATIICASIFGQAQCLLNLNLPRILALEAPDPQIVAAEVLDCLRLEYITLAIAAREAVVLLARGALLASLCLNTPDDFDETISSNVEVVFDHFKELQAVSASEVIEEELTEAIQCGSWNLATQELFVANILFKLEERLGGTVVENCLNDTLNAVVPYAECDSCTFPNLFGLALKLLYDRIALVGATIATLNVQSYFLGESCTTVPIIDLTIPAPFPL